MSFIAVEQIRGSKYGPYHAAAYLLHTIRRAVGFDSGSILITNHRLPADLLLTIAETNHVKIQTAKEFDCGEYHAHNGAVFDRNSTVIVFQPIAFEQEISLAEQFCELYGAYAVLVKPFAIDALYEVYGIGEHEAEAAICHA